MAALTHDTTTYCIYNIIVRWGEESRSTIMNLTETDGYINDILGLKTLNERGDLLLNSFDGAHVSYEMSWWMENVIGMFDNRLPEAK